MTRRRWGWMVIVALGLSQGAAVLGCGSDCALSQTCPGEGTATGGGNGADGCFPRQNGWGVDPGCGIFVSSSRGVDGNPGTQEAPLAMIDEALARAREEGVDRIYVCGEEHAGPVTVSGPITLYGGLDCWNGWTYTVTSTRTRITAPLGEIPLRLDGRSGVVRLEDIDVETADFNREDPETRGISSIAAVAEGQVELVGGWFAAASGGHGVDAEEYTTYAKAGPVGDGGNSPCTDGLVGAGLPTVNDCGTPGDPSDDSIGGRGGYGEAASGHNGVSGEPGGADHVNQGYGEVALPCINGTRGSDGLPGMPGAGATGIGTISAAGYAGVTGGEGGRGYPAQGGGGGGGAKGGTGPGRCASSILNGGAGGGAGGAGGCGGAGGRGGGPGGSSIALISLDASLTIDGTVFSTAFGGRGGAGGTGQGGGQGGLGGAPGFKAASYTALNNACPGGMGGRGGEGGKGGGGLGGHSIGIAYVGARPSMSDVTIYNGEGGRGGDTGPGLDPVSDGADGLLVDVQEFPP